jgi:hypothetical protein
MGRYLILKDMEKKEIYVLFALIIKEIWFVTHANISFAMNVFTK